MKRLVISQKSLELKLQMAESQLWRQQRKLTSTNLVQLTFLVRCLQPYQSYLCSNLRLLSFNRRKMIKKESLKKPCTGLIKECLLLKQQRLSGRRLRGNVPEINLSVMRGLRERCLNLSFQPQVSKPLPCRDQTLTCQLISVNLLTFYYLFRDSSSIWCFRTIYAKRARISYAPHYKAQDSRDRVLILTRNYNNVLLLTILFIIYLTY